MKKYCLALDLIDDEKLIAEYENLHRKENLRPEIIKSIAESGIQQMEIYRTGNRMFMIIEANEDFSFQRKAEMDASNEKVQDWENFVWQFQKPLPNAKPGEKWKLMDKIFGL